MVAEPSALPGPTAEDVVVALPDDERLVLPALQAVQEALGHVPADAVPQIAHALNVSVAETHGVLTFYHDLRTEPPAPVQLAVCVAEACQANGSRALMEHVEGAIAAAGGRSPDGVVEVREVFCLGNCALGPAVMLDGHVLGRVTPERLDRAVEAARAEAER